MKRLLHLWHRWLGILLGLFVLLWILSGVVMLFVGYPKLTPEEYLARLAPLAADCCIEPQAALRAGDPASTPLGLRLTGGAGAPRYLIDYGSGPLLAVDARSGQRLPPVDAAAALATAQRFSGAPATAQPQLLGEDLWSYRHSLDRDRPLWRVTSADSQHRLLYLSSHSGLVVADVSARERAWNLLGAWLHWLYPLRQVLPKGVWSWLLIHLALFATLAALLGMAIGVQRWRFAGRYRNGTRSPYPAGASRLHHLAGLVVGVLLCAWLFSGLVSMEPWGLFASRSTIAAQALHGAPLRGGGPSLAGQLEAFRQSGLLPVELHWRMLGEELHVQALDAGGASRILPLDGPAGALIALPRARLELAVRQAWPEQRAELDWLEAPDLHYYARAEPSLYSALPRRLPVLRVRFDDAPATWLHLDPYSGTVIEQLDRRRRAVRWLFKLLHSWDWPPLLRQAVLRDGLLLAASGAALLVSASGLLLGWRRLRRRARRR